MGQSHCTEPEGFGRSCEAAPRAKDVCPRGCECGSEAEREKPRQELRRQGSCNSLNQNRIRGKKCLGPYDNLMLIHLMHG